MRWHHVMSLGLLVLSASLGWAAWDASTLARRFPSLAKPRPPDRDVVVLVNVDAARLYDAPDELPDGTKITAVRKPRVQVTRRTIIEIKYHSPIDVTQSANISAKLSQTLKRRKVTEQDGIVRPNFSEPLSDSDPNIGDDDVDRLPWPVTLTLNGLGFEWTQNDIAIKANTPLAVTEIWPPRAKEAGDYVLRFSLKDVNRAAGQSGRVSDDVEMTVNGKTETVKGSDDVALPISVHQDFLPAFWFKFILLLGTGIAALSAVLVQIFGEGWGGKALKWFVGRRRVTP